MFLEESVTDNNVTIVFNLFYNNLTFAVLFFSSLCLSQSWRKDVLCKVSIDYRKKAI